MKLFHGSQTLESFEDFTIDAAESNSTHNNDQLLGRGMYCSTDEATARQYGPTFSFDFDGKVQDVTEDFKTMYAAQFGDQLTNIMDGDIELINEIAMGDEWQEFVDGVYADAVAIDWDGNGVLEICIHHTVFA